MFSRSCLLRSAALQRLMSSTKDNSVPIEQTHTIFKADFLDKAKDISLTQYAGSPDEVVPLVKTMLSMYQQQQYVLYLQQVFSYAQRDIYDLPVEVIELYLSGLTSCNSFHPSAVVEVYAAAKDKNLSFTSNVMLLDLLIRSALKFRKQLDVVTSQGRTLETLSAADKQRVLECIHSATALQSDQTVLEELLSAFREKIDLDDKFCTHLVHIAGSNNSLSVVTVSFLMKHVDISQISDTVLLRVVSKATAQGDLTASQELIETLRPRLETMEPVLSLLQLRAAAEAGNLEEIFNTLESWPLDLNMSEVDNRPILYPRGSGTLLERHPLLDVVQFLLREGPVSVDEAFFALEDRKRDGTVVTARSLDPILWCCAEMADEDRALETYKSFADFGTEPSTASMDFVTTAAASSSMNRKKFSALSKKVAANGEHRQAVRILAKHALEVGEPTWCGGFEMNEDDQAKAEKQLKQIRARRGQ